MGEGADPSSQREKVRVQKRLLEIDLLRWDGDWLFACPSPFSLVESPACPFIGSRGGRDAGGLLRSEVLSSAVEVTVATCPENGRPARDTMVT
jgi:hypothetical protein